MLGPWKDGDGTDRYACLHEPAVDEARPQACAAGLPASVALWDVDDHAYQSARSPATRSSLGGDPAGSGFIVLAPQGRNTAHYYQWPDNRGMGWDNWYRQLSPAGDVKVGETVYPENVDAATIDHFIAEAAAHRQSRHPAHLCDRMVQRRGDGPAVRAQPSQRRGGGGLFGAGSVRRADDPCPQKPVGGAPANNTEVRIYNPRVPVMNVHNGCDIAGICPNGEKLAAELRSAGVNVEDVIVDSSGKRVEACTDCVRHRSGWRTRVRCTIRGAGSLACIITSDGPRNGRRRCSSSSAHIRCSRPPRRSSRARRESMR